MIHEGLPQQLQPEVPNPLAQAEQIINATAAQEVPQVSGEVHDPMHQAVAAVSGQEALRGVMQDAGAQLPEIHRLTSTMLPKHSEQLERGRNQALRERYSATERMHSLGGHATAHTFDNRTPRLSRWGTQRLNEMRDIGAHTDTEQ
jgi:hypothetical protein